MDGEELFDRLYAYYHVNFPCFAVVRRGGVFATRPAPDGSSSVVILTDSDLADVYLEDHAEPGTFVLDLQVAADLSKVLDRLPAAVTHVTFDPNPRFHRRYPVGIIREALAKATEAV